MEQENNTNSEECLELKNIKYKTMLLNGNPLKETKSENDLSNLDKFLEDENAIDGYWKKVEGRGRPRRMYRLNPDWRLQAEELAEFWKTYMGDPVRPSCTQSPAISSPRR